jgi:hypothetical protein
VLFYKSFVLSVLQLQANINASRKANASIGKFTQKLVSVQCLSGSDWVNKVNICIVIKVIGH